MKTKTCYETHHNCNGNTCELEMVTCKKCGALIDAISVFPGKICISCHEVKFNAELARNGGILPRPDFTKVISL